MFRAKLPVLSHHSFVVAADAAMRYNNLKAFRQGESAEQKAPRKACAFALRTLFRAKLPVLSHHSFVVAADAAMRYNNLKAFRQGESAEQKAPRKACAFALRTLFRAKLPVLSHHSFVVAADAAMRYNNLKAFRQGESAEQKAPRKACAFALRTLFRAKLPVLSHHSFVVAADAAMRYNNLKAFRQGESAEQKAPRKACAFALRTLFRAKLPVLSHHSFVVAACGGVPARRVWARLSPRPKIHV